MSYPGIVKFDQFSLKYLSFLCSDRQCALESDTYNVLRLSIALRPRLRGPCEFFTSKYLFIFLSGKKSTKTTCYSRAAKKKSISSNNFSKNTSDSSKNISRSRRIHLPHANPRRSPFSHSFLTLKKSRASSNLHLL